MISQHVIVTVGSSLWVLVVLEGTYRERSVRLVRILFIFFVHLLVGVTRGYALLKKGGRLSTDKQVGSPLYWCDRGGWVHVLLLDVHPQLGGCDRG